MEKEKKTKDIVQILGCGSSAGVPVIACDCFVCSAVLKRNKRTRCSLLFSSMRRNSPVNILVDFGFDIKDQLVRAKLRHLNAAILTHYHADHACGVDHLKIFSFLQKQPIDIFTDEETAKKLYDYNSYLFKMNNLRLRVVDFYEKILIDSVKIQLFKQDHGTIPSIGVKINDFVYSSDVVDFPPESHIYLERAKQWVVDCISYNSTVNHAGLDKILLWQEKYKPEKIFLTNMSHKLDYYELQKDLPKNIIPLYDGYKIYI